MEQRTKNPSVAVVLRSCIARAPISLLAGQTSRRTDERTAIQRIAWSPSYLLEMMVAGGWITTADLPASRDMEAFYYKIFFTMQNESSRTPASLISNQSMSKKLEFYCHFECFQDLFRTHFLFLCMINSKLNYLSHKKQKLEWLRHDETSHDLDLLLFPSFD